MLLKKCIRIYTVLVPTSTTHFQQIEQKKIKGLIFDKFHNTVAKVKVVLTKENGNVRRNTLLK